MLAVKLDFVSHDLYFENITRLDHLVSECCCSDRNRQREIILKLIILCVWQLLLLVLILYPRWGTADAEIKTPQAVGAMLDSLFLSL